MQRLHLGLLVFLVGMFGYLVYLTTDSSSQNPPQQPKSALNYKIPANKLNQHVVRSGESLQKIAEMYDVTPRFLSRINHIGESGIFPGMELNVVQGPFELVIDKNAEMVAVYLGTDVIRRFPIGKEHTLPSGELTILSKSHQPATPAGGLGPVLGMGEGLGIFGGPNMAEKRGIYMEKAAFGEVYHLVVVNSPVHVK